jgi:hypothetical protein
MGQEIPAVTKLYDIILWFLPQVEKFPRDYKFTLGDRIVENLLGSLDTLIEAVYTKDRNALLRKLNLNLEKLRYQTRLAKDLQALSMKKYEHAAREINELGKMIGGWMKVKSGENA